MTSASRGESRPTKMDQVLVRMPADLHAAVKADAAEQDRTMAQTIRRAVRQYLNRSA